MRRCCRRGATSATSGHGSFARQSARGRKAAAGKAQKKKKQSEEKKKQDKKKKQPLKRTTVEEEEEEEEEQAPPKQPEKKQDKKKKQGPPRHVDEEEAEEEEEEQATPAPRGNLGYSLLAFRQLWNVRPVAVNPPDLLLLYARECAVRLDGEVCKTNFNKTTTRTVTYRKTYRNVP